MDYRTYGKSTGKLSEKALFMDGQLFYEYALRHYNESSISLYGRSLGTGIASKLASENNPYKLILETPYYSLMDVGQNRFPFLPVKWFLSYQLKNYEFIKNVRCPIAIFHGTEDRVVPYDSGKRLFDSIPFENKEMYTIEGGGHNNLVTFDSYLKAIDTVLKMDHPNRSEDR